MKLFCYHTDNSKSALLYVVCFVGVRVEVGTCLLFTSIKEVSTSPYMNSSLTVIDCPGSSANKRANIYSPFIDWAFWAWVCVSSRLWPSILSACVRHQRVIVSLRVPAYRFRRTSVTHSSPCGRRVELFLSKHSTINSRPPSAETVSYPSARIAPFFEQTWKCEY